MEQETRPHFVILVCSSCNETGMISQQAFNKLITENHGKPEIACQHCGGRMGVPFETKEFHDEKPAFFSRN